MTRFGMALAASLMALSGIAPVHAQDSSSSSAEKLRRLDIMLMVTGLRCRTGADNFNAEYGAFTTAHLAELNAASDQLRKNFASQLGQLGAARALDRLGVTMANQYGQGHPWLTCADLKAAAANLAQINGVDALAEAADDLLSVSPRESVATLIGH